MVMAGVAGVWMIAARLGDRVRDRQEDFLLGNPERDPANTAHSVPRLGIAREPV